MSAPAGSGLNFGVGGAVTQASSVLGGGFGSGGITAQSTPMQNPLASTQAPTFGTVNAQTPTFGAVNAQTPTFGAVSTQTPTFGAFAASTSTAAPASTAAPGLSFLSSAPLSSTIAASAAPSSTAATGLTFGTGLSAAKTTKSVSFNLSTPTPATTASSTVKSILKLGTPISTTSTTTDSTVPLVTSGSGDQVVDYEQLQDLTNKWTIDFEDLQKVLLTQTSETINRDVILASNEDKIEKLVNSVKNLKSEQTVVEQQLDFILSQQRDLDECLVSLEEEVSSYFPEVPADDMHKLVQNIDSRLKKTLETSKEIITKLNDRNRLYENVANPMVSIGRILNHHTNSIQMLENMNEEGQTKLNELQKIFQQYIGST